VHLAVCRLVRGLVLDGLLDGVHDLADGGLGLALAEMAVRSGVGFRVDGDGDDDGDWTHADLFGEGPSRVVACVAAERVDEVLARAANAAVAATVIGTAGGDRLIVGELVDLPLAEATDRWRTRLPDVMAAGAEH
jgi:phosphoribosylformylglycinamidine synthase